MNIFDLDMFLYVSNFSNKKEWISPLHQLNLFCHHYCSIKKFLQLYFTE